MAYQFTSPGAMATEAIEDLLVQRVAMQRQQMLDELNRKNIEASIADRAKARELQQQQIGALADGRAAAARTQRSNEFLKRASSIAQGAEVDQNVIDEGRDLGYGHLFAPGQEKTTFTGDDASEPLVEQGRPTFRGLPDQIKEADKRKRLEGYLQSLDPNSREYKALQYQLMTGQNAPAGLFDPKPSASSDITEYEYYVDQTRKAGQQPMSFEEWMKWAANLKAQSGGGGAPYFTPVQTGNGIVPFDNRAGQFLWDRRVPLKPGASAEEALTSAEMVLSDLSNVTQLYDPQWVGPLAGRYNTMRAALVANGDDAPMIDMMTSVARIGNTVINLRTGKQMNENEAKRIIAEIPGMNEPPVQFVTKLQNVYRYFREWYARRARGAYGMTTPDDVTKMLQGEVPTVPSHTPTGKNPLSGSQFDSWDAYTRQQRTATPGQKKR